MHGIPGNDNFMMLQQIFAEEREREERMDEVLDGFNQEMLAMEQQLAQMRAEQNAALAEPEEDDDNFELNQSSPADGG